MAEVCSLELSPGQRLSWREWGRGQPLIMLHGWSMSSTVFREVAVPLAEHYRVLCPDLPGHGKSDPAPVCSLEGLAAVIASWATQLKLGPAALLGWSLGGQVALQLAIQRKFKLTHLLLVATTPRFCQVDGWQHGLPQTQLRALERNLERAYEKTLGDFFNLQFATEELGKERYREILQFAVRSSCLPAAEDAQKSLRILGQEDLRHKLSNIDLPTLVMHGQDDQIIPVAAGKFLAEQIPDARLEILSGVGHAPFFSRPKESIVRWLDFLT